MPVVALTRQPIARAFAVAATATVAAAEKVVQHCCKHRAQGHEVPCTRVKALEIQ